MVRILPKQAQTRLLHVLRTADSLSYFVEQHPQWPRMLAFRPWLFILLLCTTFAAADLVDDIVDAIQNAASCTACKALLLPLKGLATLGDGPFTSTIKAVCNAIGVGIRYNPSFTPILTIPRWRTRMFATALSASKVLFLLTIYARFRPLDKPLRSSVTRFSGFANHRL